MLDHVSVPVQNIEATGRFYDSVLSTIGMKRRTESSRAIGYACENSHAPTFWLLQAKANESATPGVGLHISFVAKDRTQVDAFHSTAMSHGGRNAGDPGERPEYTPPFYGAFILDPNGYKIEAVCRT